MVAKKIKRDRASASKSDAEFLKDFVPRWSEWIERPPPIHRWLVEGWLPHQGITILSGPQKRATKSLFAYQLATIVGEGIRNVYFTCHQQGEVIYIQAEMGHRETWDRVWQGTRGFGMNAPSQHVWFNYLQGTKLDSLASLNKMKRALTLIKPVLIILDTFFYLHDCDENSPTELKCVVDILQEWQREYGCGILLLSHLNKARGEDPTAPLSSQIRGSNVLPGVMDYHIALRKYDDKPLDESPPTVNFEGRGIPVTKGKLIWEFDNRIRAVGNEGLQEVYPHSATCKYVTEAMERYAEAKEVYDYAAKLIEDTYYDMSELMEEWGLDKTAAMKVRDKCKKAGLLKLEEGEYVLTGPLEEPKVVAASQYKVTHDADGNKLEGEAAEERPETEAPAPKRKKKKRPKKKQPKREAVAKDI